MDVYEYFKQSSNNKISGELLSGIVLIRNRTRWPKIVFEYFR